MKVGILTFPHSPSLGAMLQMGALYHVVEKMGHEVEVINYVSERVNHQQKKKATPKSIILSILAKMFLKSSIPSFRAFEETLNMFPTVPTSSKEGLLQIDTHFDRIIVGSDQVWNSVVTGHDLAFYLDFCTDSRKKVSYAASFGYKHADKECECEIKQLLNDFTYISVREKDGQDIVKSLTGRDAELVLDPTLLVDPQYLRNVAKETQLKKYVLFFCVKPSPKLRRIAEEYAMLHGYELVTVGGRMKERFDRSKHPAFGVGPGEFVGLIDDAECVFTNSFHGMAVSIALHSNFFVEFSSDTNSRLRNLAEMLQLEDRIIFDSVPKAADIDYHKVDALLKVQKDKSYKYLKLALSE